MKLSVVAVAYNNIDDLDGFLGSLLTQETDLELEVIIVDNGSTDGTREYLRQARAVTLIESDDNLGYGLAMNRGLAQATGDTGDLVILSNLDIEFRDGSVDAMRYALIGDAEAIASCPSRIAGVGPVIETPDQRIYPQRMTDLGVGYAVGYFSGFSTRCQHRSTPGHECKVDTLDVDIPWLHGCCGMFRRDALDEVGGYDERFFMYFEDADLGGMLRQRGWRMRIANDARVLHKEGASSGSAATRRWFIESWHLYARKHLGIVDRTAAFVAVTIVLVLQCLWQAAKATCVLPNRTSAMTTYLVAHLRMATRSVENERAIVVAEMRARWPVESPAESSPSPASEATSAECENERDTVPLR